MWRGWVSGLFCRCGPIVFTPPLTLPGTTERNGSGGGGGGGVTAGMLFCMVSMKKKPSNASARFKLSLARRRRSSKSCRLTLKIFMTLRRYKLLMVSVKLFCRKSFSLQNMTIII
ncbi:hypothetical protein Droror1_Dr00023224 [Drosera rotundifolia]